MSKDWVFNNFVLLSNIVQGSLRTTLEINRILPCQSMEMIYTRFKVLPGDNGRKKTFQVELKLAWNKPKSFGLLKS